jgi:hypothetical protein
MNFDRTISPNLGSGRISRFSGRRRRLIGLIPFASTGWLRLSNFVTPNLFQGPFGGWLGLMNS